MALFGHFDVGGVSAVAVRGRNDLDDLTTLVSGLPVTVTDSRGSTGV